MGTGGGGRSQRVKRCVITHDGMVVGGNARTRHTHLLDGWMFVGFRIVPRGFCRMRHLVVFEEGVSDFLNKQAVKI